MCVAPPVFYILYALFCFLPVTKRSIVIHHTEHLPFFTAYRHEFSFGMYYAVLDVLSAQLP